MTTMVNAFCEECVDDYCEGGNVMPPLEKVCEVDNDEGIGDVYLTDQGHPVTGDPALAASWTRISNTSDGSGTTGNVANPIRHLEVFEGEKPKATLTYKKNRKGTRARLKNSTRSITFIDEDDSQAKYEMYTAYQCNGNALMYYKSGKQMYGVDPKLPAVGSAVGIACVVKPVYGITPTDTAGMAHSWTVTIEWDAKCEEGRVESPI